MRKQTLYSSDSLLYLAFLLGPFLGYILLKVFNWSFSNFYGFLLILVAINKIGLPNKYNTNLHFSSATKWFFFFFLYATAIDYSKGIVNFNYKFFYSNKYLLSFVILFISDNIHLNEHLISKSQKMCKVILLISFVIIIYQQMIDEYFFVNHSYAEAWYSGSKFTNRLPSIFSWTGSLGVGLTFMPIFAFVFSDVLKKNKKIGLWIMLGGVFAFLTKSRWIMVNFLLILTMILMYKKLKAKTIILYSILIIVITFLALNFLDRYVINTKSVINDRILQTQYGGITEGTAGSRLLAIEIFLKLFPKNPIFGVGAKVNEELESELKERSSQIHIGYLSLFYYYGLIGGIIFLAFLSKIIKRFIKIAKLTHEWGPFYGFMCWALANLTLVSLRLFPWEGVVLSLFLLSYYESEYKNSIKNTYINQRQFVGPTKS